MKYSVVTFGCRVNQADSFVIEDQLRRRGMVHASPEDVFQTELQVHPLQQAAALVLLCSQGAKQIDVAVLVGGPVGVGNASTTSLVVQSRSQLADVGNIPYIAFLENDRSWVVR